jgi:LytR cell envelope-related transcriptional attenuator
MASLPFALSVHHFISSVGADAGFASLIGLALLVLLYFAHARETATLRSRADEAGLRVQDLEAQLADLADQVAALPAEISVRAAGPRVAAASGGVAQHAVAGAGYGSLPPAAPAGVGAPALAAATRLIPMPEVPVQEPEPEQVHGGTNGASRVPVAAPAGTMRAPAPAPAPAGVGSRPPAGPGRGVGGPPRPNGGQARPAGGPRPGTGQNRSGAGRPVAPTRSAPRRSRTGRVILALIVVLIAAAVVVAAVLVLGKSNKSHKPPKPSAASSLTKRRTNSRSVLVQPSKITVSVLNGTDLTGLAGRISAKLVSLGFKKGAVTNAANQNETTSIVAYYSPGYRVDALAVASELKLPATTVQQVAAGTKTVACSFAPVGCGSQVYVTVGSDLSAQ